MNRLLKNITIIFLLLNLFNISNSEENFFERGIKFYDDKKYDDAKFMFERSIVFNPKNSKSYLYLAKIYNHENDQKKRKKFRHNTFD